jgi:hypothetical protein
VGLRERSRSAVLLRERPYRSLGLLGFGAMLALPQQRVKLCCDLEAATLAMCAFQQLSN